MMSMGITIATASNGAVSKAFFEGEIWLKEGNKPLQWL